MTRRGGLWGHVIRLQLHTVSAIVKPSTTLPSELYTNVEEFTLIGVPSATHLGERYMHT